MGTISRLHPWLTKRGRATVTGQSIAILSTYTLSIALGRSDFKQAFIVLTTPNSVAGVVQRRSTASIYCTDVASEAVSQATARISTSWTDGYYFARTYTDSAHKAYFSSAESKISEFYFGDSAEAIQITSARINGSNLEIVFLNGSSSSAHTLTTHVEYRAQRLKAA